MTRRGFVCAGCVSALVVLPGIADAQPTSFVSPYIEVQMTVVVAERRPLLLSGTANLPDGFIAIVTLSEAGVPIAQDDIVINGGRFSAGPFSNQGDPIPPGTYTVAVDSPISALQPENVRKIIGEDGHRLRGPLTARNPLDSTPVVRFVGRLTLQ